jgi:hypothetical protein
MNPEDLLALLGRNNSDPLVEAALIHYAVRNRPEVEIDAEDPDGPVVETQSWVKNSRAGIEFGFHDEAAWRGLDETEFGAGPLVLTQIYLYGQHEGVRQYQQPLPFELQLSDDRATVRQKLAGLESTRHSYIRDTWDAPEFRMTVAFTEGDRSVDFVLCNLREPALPALPYAIAPVPDVDRIVATLGRPLSDRALLEAFGPLGFEDRIDEIKEAGEADFLNPYGVALGFSPPIDTTSRDSLEIVLSSVTLYQERELGARGWPGALPLETRFDDSFETLIRKFGRTPDHQTEYEFAVYAVWHEPTATLRIVYDAMENRVARVSLYAPGFWEKWHED